MIPTGDVLRVLEATNLLEAAQRYARFRRSGKEWAAVCIFHKERTASLHVNPAKQRFYCRGCHANGDAVKFIMLAEGLSFPKAVGLLAEQAGITLGEEKRGPEDTYVRAIAAEAQAFWREVRLRYAVRQARAVAYRNLARRDADATEDQDRFWLNMELYRKFARSAARWDRIITRLDSASKGELLQRYIGIRQRHPRVANAYRSARELESACISLEQKAAAMIPQMPASRFAGLMRTICAHFAR